MCYNVFVPIDITAWYKQITKLIKTRFVATYFIRVIWARQRPVQTASTGKLQFCDNNDLQRRRQPLRNDFSKFNIYGGEVGCHFYLYALD